MACQDAWRVCHADFKLPFSSLEDACERLLPYHVLADYEVEDDDRILDWDSTGQALSRSQQWDHNIATKVAEFTSAFKKQALAFNIITPKRALGEFRSKERLMIEQTLFLKDKRAMMEPRTRSSLKREPGEMLTRLSCEWPRLRKSDKLMLITGPCRNDGSRPWLGWRPQGREIMSSNHGLEEQEKGVNPAEIMNRWANSTQKGGDWEPSDDFLNDEEAENGEAVVQSELA